MVSLHCCQVVNECCSYLTLKPKYNASIICYSSNWEFSLFFAAIQLQIFHFLAAKNL